MPDEQRITADQVLAWEPCSDYSEDRIHELCCDDGITPREIAALDIPAEDRFWVLTHLLGDRDNRLLAADSAESVVHLCSDDLRSRTAITTARQFAFGLASRKELAGARVAAEYAAGYAAADASVAAARAASGYAFGYNAADEAADAAGYAAADKATDEDWGEAWDAVGAAARDAAWDAHIARALDYIEGRVDIDAIRESVSMEVTSHA